MKRKRLAVKWANEMSASHGTPTRTRVVPDKRRNACDPVGSSGVADYTVLPTSINYG